MPVPGGEITSTETWGLVPPVTEEATEFAEAVLELDDEKLVEAIETADAEEATEEYLPEVEDDLPTVQ